VGKQAGVADMLLTRRSCGKSCIPEPYCSHWGTYIKDPELVRPSYSVVTRSFAGRFWQQRPRQSCCVRLRLLELSKRKREASQACDFFFFHPIPPPTRSITQRCTKIFLSNDYAGSEKRSPITIVK
jgi:hypothetical protein